MPFGPGDGKAKYKAKPCATESLLSLSSFCQIHELTAQGEFQARFSPCDFNATSGGLATNNIHVASNGAMF